MHREAVVTDIHKVDKNERVFLLERVFLPQVDYYTSVKLNGFRDIEKKALPVCIHLLSVQGNFPYFLAGIQSCLC